MNCIFKVWKNNNNYLTFFLFYLHISDAKLRVLFIFSLFGDFHPRRLHYARDWYEPTSPQ